MPPPHLHPRSRMTSSLFATTLFASFFVVALPHVLPCPAPRAVLADGDMSDGTTKRRRRKRPQGAEAQEGVVEINNISEADTEMVRLSKRECPVPKPKGVLGDLFGFNKSSGDQSTTRPDS